MSTVALIPIRGGSKSIPHKNIRPLLGRPLVHWTMQAALDCPYIERVYVASEDPKLRAVASQIAHPKLFVIQWNMQPIPGLYAARLSFAR